jgi:hypothetical protein
MEYDLNEHFEIECVTKYIYRDNNASHLRIKKTVKDCRPNDYTMNYLQGMGLSIIIITSVILSTFVIWLIKKK